MGTIQYAHSLRLSTSRCRLPSTPLYYIALFEIHLTICGSLENNARTYLLLSVRVAAVDIRACRVYR
jgi:hypothetical protein